MSPDQKAASNRHFSTVRYIQFFDNTLKQSAWPRNLFAYRMLGYPVT